MADKKLGKPIYVEITATASGTSKVS